MARIRSVKPEFWTSEDIAALSIPTRLAFIGLWNYVDDAGIGVANERLITSSLFPMDDPRESLAIVRRALDELSNGGLIVLYEGGGKRLLAVTGWRHQKIDRPTRSKYVPPTPEQLATVMTSSGTAGSSMPKPLAAQVDEDSRGLDEDSSPDLGIKGSRDQGSEGAREPARERAAASRGSRLPDDWQPSREVVEAMRDECPDIDQRAEFVKFRDYWAGVPGAKGRKVDWTGTYRNWIRRAAERGTPSRPGRGPSRSGPQSNAESWGALMVPTGTDGPALVAITGGAS